MKYSSIKKIVFAVYALGLLAFPLITVWNQQSTFEQGSIYKFKCAPVDPNDIFRGKYVQLAFENTSIDQSNIQIDTDEPVYGLIERDQYGYAFVSAIANAPFENQPFLKLQNVRTNGDLIRFEYPFDRLYMNEKKAPKAEELFRDRLQNDVDKVYARVYISEGRYLLDDVFVNDMTLKELIE